MKKAIAIPIIFLILFSGIRINIASHYCNGSFIDTIVSFSGKLASCGMAENPAGNDGIKVPHTCSDDTFSYTISSNYIPSSPGIGEVLKQVILPVIIPFLHEKAAVSYDVASFSGNGPPGAYFPRKAAPELICVFRI